MKIQIYPCKHLPPDYGGFFLPANRPSAWRAGKLFTVLGRGKRELLAEMVTQGRCLTKSGLFSNAVDAETAALKIIFRP